LRLLRNRLLCAHPHCPFFLTRVLYHHINALLKKIMRASRPAFKNTHSKSVKKKDREWNPLKMQFQHNFLYQRETKWGANRRFGCCPPSHFFLTQRHSALVSDAGSKKIVPNSPPFFFYTRPTLLSTVSLKNTVSPTSR
jgi:hypothetical protein